MAAKYYGFSPEEIAQMPLPLFGDYLNNMPEMERLFNGTKANSAEDVADDEGGGNVRDILARYGIHPRA